MLFGEFVLWSLWSRVRLSVCVSVRRLPRAGILRKRQNRIKQITLHNSSGTLAFGYRRRWWNSNKFARTGHQTHAKLEMWKVNRKSYILCQTVALRWPWMIPIAQIAPILRLGSPLKFVKSVKIALEFCHRYGMPSISLEVTNYPFGVRAWSGRRGRLFTFEAPWKGRACRI